MRSVYLIVHLAKKRYFSAQHLYVKELGFESIVEIGGVVRDFVHPVDELRFARRAQIEKALCELLNDAQRVQIVIEKTAVHAHQLVELSLAGMAERRMADVVNESESFGELVVQAQRGGNGARDLRNFKRVRQPVAEVVGIACGKNCGFGSGRRKG